ncbi:MAG: GAF domain-containing protein [Chloroflexi bacterium]|nr:GAF domain-containing protein [Chloroflexota bacterium]
MTLHVNGALLTDLGRRRGENEDWCGSLQPESGDDGAEQSVWAVADGVSNLGTGRDAARLAVETVLAAGWDSAPRGPETVLRTAFDTANRRLVERAQESHDKSRPYATTLLAAVIQGDDLWIANAGDCRAYLLRRGALRQLTRDHTWVAEQVALGKLRPEDVATHPRRNLITRCLGQRATLEPDVFHERLEAGDRVVLCSDGITRHVVEAEIAQIAGAAEPRVACRQLVDLANARGGTDNITIGVLDVTLVQSRERTSGPRPTLTDLSFGRLAALQAISQRINASLDLDRTLAAIVESLIELTGAERGFIMLRNNETGRLEFRVGRNLDAAGIERDVAISRNIVGQVVRDGTPLLLGDARGDERFKAFESVVVQGLRSVICVPLVVRGEAIGILYVDNSLHAELFTREDLELVTAFANMAASAIDNARLHQQLAEQVRAIGAMKTTQDRILRSVTSAIIAVDRAGTITSYNRGAEDVLAVPTERAVGKPLSSVLPPRFMLALGAPFDGGGSEPGMTIQGFEMAGDLPGRGYVHLQHRLSPLRDEAGATIGYVLVLDDRTDRERLERERRQAAAEREHIKSIFEHYMAPAVFQELLRQGPERTGISGDRRDLTILFADIRGFTGMSERLPPERVVEVLNGYLDAATKVIFEHQGTIDKFIGDAIMALFGAPVPIENHPIQAVRAALAMQRTFAETSPAGGQRASFGIGINSGEGIVGTIGASQLMSYTVIGDVVNVAARLQGEARAGEVLITEETFRRVSGEVEAEPLGSIYVKGRLSPVTMYKVTSLRR